MSGTKSMDRKRWSTWWQAGRPGSLTSEEFKTSMERWVNTGGHSGPEPSEKLSEYTALNAVRMRRIAKTYAISEPMEALLTSEKCSGQHWVVITESWCGDAAQSSPIIEAWARKAGVPLEWVLRDGANGIIDDFLTRGGRSVPIWIVADKRGHVLQRWGPRPKPAMQMVRQYRNLEEPKPAYSEFAAEVQLWYAKDKGRTFEKEAMKMLNLD